VELATGLLYLAVVLTKDSASEIVLGLLLVTLLVPITVIDLDQRIIPNKLVGPGAAAALLTGLLLDRSFVPEQLIAGAAAFTFFFLAALAYPRGMGMGDVKLAGMLGLYLGRAVAPAIFIALITGVAVGAIIIARVGSKAGRKTAVPFGPFLALGGMVAFFVGTPLVDTYLHHY
jgi:leader peptidase (prepilin peptidase)/N-methyltransferase